MPGRVAHKSILFYSNDIVMTLLCHHTNLCWYDDPWIYDVSWLMYDTVVVIL